MYIHIYIYIRTHIIHTCVLHAHGDGRGEVEGEHLEGPAHDAKLLKTGCELK